MKTLLLLCLVLLLSGCSEPEHVSVTEFKREYAMVDHPQSMRSVQYLGMKDQKAYLKISTSPVAGNKWNEHVIWVGLNELDANFRRSLPVDAR